MFAENSIIDVHRLEDKHFTLNGKVLAGESIDVIIEKVF